MLSLCKSHWEQRGFAWCWVWDSAAAWPGDLGVKSELGGEIPVLKVLEIQSKAGVGNQAAELGGIPDSWTQLLFPTKIPMAPPASSSPPGAVWGEGFASEPPAGSWVVLSGGKVQKRRWK